MCTPIGSKFSMEQMMTHVVRAVAHDLELELLPAEDRFFYQHFADRAQARPPAKGSRTSSIVSDAAADAAQREGGRMISGRPRSFGRVGFGRAGGDPLFGTRRPISSMAL